MEIVNVLVKEYGSIELLKSFVILNEKDKKKIVEKAEKYFLKIIKEDDSELTKDDLDEILGYQTHISHTSCKEFDLIWSEVDK